MGFRYKINILYIYILMKINTYSKKERSHTYDRQSI